MAAADVGRGGGHGEFWALDTGWAESAPHRLDRARALGAGGPERVWSFPESTGHMLQRYQMIISSWSVGPCSLGGLHLLSSS